MNSWAIVAIVAIAVWGVVQAMKAKRGVITDKQGNESIVAREDEGARREIEELRERVKVLERITTESNTLDARERKRISAEIEALRDDN